MFATSSSFVSPLSLTGVNKISFKWLSATCLFLFGTSLLLTKQSLLCCFHCVSVPVLWCHWTDSSCQTPKQTGMSCSTETTNNRMAEINIVPQWPCLKRREYLNHFHAYFMKSFEKCVTILFLLFYYSSDDLG